ncbi:hypothetical protein D3C81_1433580 [compost metagenome]
MQQLGHRRDRGDAEAHRVAAGRSPADQASHRLQAVLPEETLGNHQATGRRVVLLGSVAGGDGAVLQQRGQFRHGFEAGVLADAFVAADDQRRALALRHLDGQHFPVETPFGPGLGGLLVAARGPAVGLFAGDAVFADDHLDRFGGAGALAIAADRLRVGPAAIQAVMEGHVTQPRAPAHAGAVVLDIAHALDAGDQQAVGDAGLDLHGGVDHRLQAGAAAAVDAVAGDLVRQPGQRCGIAADARRFAGLVGLRDDHFVDALLRHSGAPQHSADDSRSELGGR